LKEQIAKVYLFLRSKIKSSQHVSYSNFRLSQLVESEDRQVYDMDTFLVIEYIKAAIGVVLDIKFEEIERKLHEKSIDASEAKSLQKLGEEKMASS